MQQLIDISLVYPKGLRVTGVCRHQKHLPQAKNETQRLAPTSWEEKSPSVSTPSLLLCAKQNTHLAVMIIEEDSSVVPHCVHQGTLHGEVAVKSQHKNIANSTKKEDKQKLCCVKEKHWRIHRL